MDPYQWAARRDGVLSNEIAMSTWTPRQIDRRIASGELRRERQGVLVVNGAPPTWRQQVRAVLLAAGTGVAASHVTSVRLLGGTVDDVDGIHVIGDLARHVRLPGVIAHRSGLLVPGDVVTVDAMPCTSALRTVIDLSGMFDPAALGRVVDDFLRRRRLALEDLRGRVSLTRPAPGRSVKTLKIVLAQRIPGYDPGETELEGRLRRIIDANGLPTPTHQHRVSYGKDRYRMDFAWPDRRLYLEGNGFGYHRLATDLDGDARRQNEMVLDGWRPIELTWRMTDAEIADTLRRFLTSSPPSV